MTYGTMPSPAKKPLAGFQLKDREVSEAERVKSVNTTIESPSQTDAKDDETEQAGTKKIEAITSSWSKWGLVVAYIS